MIDLYPDVCRISGRTWGSHDSPIHDNSHGKWRCATEAVADLLSLLASSLVKKRDLALAAGLWILHGRGQCAYTSTPDVAWPAQ